MEVKYRIVPRYGPSHDTIPSHGLFSFSRTAFSLHRLSCYHSGEFGTKGDRSCKHWSQC